MGIEAVPAGSYVVERLAVLSGECRRSINQSGGGFEFVYGGTHILTEVADGGVISRLWRVTHHDAARECDAATAVRVGHDVAVSDTQQRDGDQPH